MNKDQDNNQILSKKLRKIAYLLDIKGVAYKPKAYNKAAEVIDNLEKDISIIYNEKGLDGIKEIKNIGDSIAEKIVEFLKKDKIKYLEELDKETKIRQIITHFFNTKGYSLDQIKKNAKKKKIIYSRFTRPAKQLLELAESLEEAKKAITIVSKWAKSRNLDYAIETVFKKWPELDKLKPKEKTKRAFYKGNPMVWKKGEEKWYVVDEDGQWREFAGDEKEIEWIIEDDKNKND